MMTDQLPALQDREARLEDAFYIPVVTPQVFHFVQITESLYWLKGLYQRGINPEILSMDLTRESVHLLVQLSRIVEYYGEVVTQYGRIWIESSTEDNGGWDFLANQMEAYVRGDL